MEDVAIGYMFTACVSGAGASGAACFAIMGVEFKSNPSQIIGFGVGAVALGLISAYSLAVGTGLTTPFINFDIS